MALRARMRRHEGVSRSCIWGGCFVWRRRRHQPSLNSVTHSASASQPQSCGDLPIISCLSTKRSIGSGGPPIARRTVMPSLRSFTLTGSRRAFPKDFVMSDVSVRCCTGSVCDTPHHAIQVNRDRSATSRLRSRADNGASVSSETSSAVAVVASKSVRPLSDSVKVSRRLSSRSGIATTSS